MTLLTKVTPVSLIFKKNTNDHETTDDPSKQAASKLRLHIRHKGMLVLPSSTHTALSTTQFHFPVPGKRLQSSEWVSEAQVTSNFCKALTLCVTYLEAGKGTKWAGIWPHTN